MNRSYYSDTIENFNLTKPEEIIGKMAILSKFADEVTQKSACGRKLEFYKKSFLNIKEASISNIPSQEWAKESMCFF